jgi:hypothetical protein
LVAINRFFGEDSHWRRFSNQDSAYFAQLHLANPQSDPSYICVKQLPCDSKRVRGAKTIRYTGIQCRIKHQLLVPTGVGNGAWEKVSNLYGAPNLP